jgi:invasion protein IalB
LDGSTQNGEALVAPPRRPASAEAPTAVQPAAPPVEAAAPVSVPAASASVAANNGARTSEVKAVGDWSLECFKPAFDEGACQIVHRVVSGQGSQVVLVFSLAASAADVPANVQIALPLGLALSRGVQVLIGSEYQNHVPLSRCTPQGCLIEGTLTSALLAAMRKERAGMMTVTDERGEAIKLPFSLIGFSDAYTQMIAENSASAPK